MNLSTSIAVLICVWFPIAMTRAQDTKQSTPLKATAVLHPIEGNNLRGTITFREVADDLKSQPSGDAGTL